MLASTRPPRALLGLLLFAWTVLASPVDGLPVTRQGHYNSVQTERKVHGRNICTSVKGAAHITPEVDAHCPTCPYFLPTPTEVTTPEGVPANLTCGVRHLGDRKVSWIRRKDVHVLTTGDFTYTTANKFRALHLPGSPYWTLQVDNPTVSDSGIYECQVSTQPKIFRSFTLNVVVPNATITGVREMFMKAGSDINITCVIKGAIRGAPITWYHVLPRPPHTTEQVEEIKTSDRGGVQVVTDKHAGTSWLLVTRATWRDAGNYTCAPDYAKPASVSVHVLDEEAPAELHHDPQPSSGSPPTTTTTSRPPYHTLLLLLFLLVLLESVLGGSGTSRLSCFLCCHLLATACFLPTLTTFVAATVDPGETWTLGRIPHGSPVHQMSLRL
ncbi:hemicentin-2-like isoform X2 [Panulirus ornatus]|uniref:hemicentin-2-like isoform X2 n=1 Tax=Panulirus ornatus TaxID=150431 RepID=UPI003A86D075